MKKIIATEEQIKFAKYWVSQQCFNKGIDNILKDPSRWPPEFVIDDRMISLEEAETLPMDTVVEVSNNEHDWHRALFKNVKCSIFVAVGYEDSLGTTIFDSMRWPEGPKMQAKLVPLEDEQQ